MGRYLIPAEGKLVRAASHAWKACGRENAALRVRCLPPGTTNRINGSPLMEDGSVPYGE